MNKQFDLSSAKGLLAETFRDNQITYIESLAKSILETEDFYVFSKYTRNFVREFFEAFIYRISCNIWVHFSDYNISVEQYFKKLSPKMAHHIAIVKKDLLAKNIINDFMSDEALKYKLTSYFDEYENREEFNRVQADYVNIKNEFDNIIRLAHSFYECGSNMVTRAEGLFSLYLKYKEAIFKGMGFDVKLEFTSIDNFNFIYNDDRLSDPTERERYEYIVMNAALKAAMPGFDGNIDVFKNIVASI